MGICMPCFTYFATLFMTHTHILYVTNIYLAMVLPIKLLALAKLPKSILAPLFETKIIILLTFCKKPNFFTKVIVQLQAKLVYKLVPLII